MNLQDFIKKYGNVHVDEKELKELLGIKDKKYFVPNEGIMYYYVTSRGDKAFTKNNDTGFDEDIFKNNEVFKTKEEAEEHAKKQRFLLKMKRDFLDNSDEIDWEEEIQTKYQLSYERSINRLMIYHFYSLQTESQYITTNKEWLEEYIEKHEEEIKKYYFGIDKQ